MAGTCYEAGESKIMRRVKRCCHLPQVGAQGHPSACGHYRGDFKVPESPGCRDPVPSGQASSSRSFARYGLSDASHSLAKRAHYAAQHTAGPWAFRPRSSPSYPLCLPTLQPHLGSSGRDGSFSRPNGSGGIGGADRTGANHRGRLLSGLCP